MKQILVLFGGCSPEYSVSLAVRLWVCSTHMDRSRCLPHPWWASPGRGPGCWYGGALEPPSRMDRWQQDRSRLPRPAPCRLDRGGRQPCSCWTAPAVSPVSFEGAFPLIHGSNGEDGTLQGLL